MRPSKNIWLIIRREYLSRVRKRTFLLTTFLTPLGFAALFIIPILTSGMVEEEHYTVYVKGDNQEYLNLLLEQNNSQFHFSPYHPQVNSAPEEREAILEIRLTDSTRLESSILTKKRISLQTKSSLEMILRDVHRSILIEAAGIAPTTYEVIRNASVNLTTGQTEHPEKGNTEIAAAIGFGIGFLIYFMVLIYGVMVMRGVVEEKNSRIVEIMVSTVKPFELMMGKIIGIGAVGLTQFLLWLILSFGVLTSLTVILGPPDPAALEQMPQPQAAQALQQEQVLNGMMQEFSIGNLGLFLFYFLGGFLLFGSLFAGVGSTMNEDADSQQLTFPIILPLIIPTLFLSNIIQAPNGLLAKFFSIFPLFSPTTMMVRKAATDVPWWELGLSMALLLLAFIGSVWVAAKIYRTGILMYGKKVSWREISKWLFSNRYT